MNRNNYRLTKNPTELSREADRLMEIITFLSNERVYKTSFPSFSTIKYDGIDETELIEAIEDLENIYKKAKKQAPYNILHHNAHLYALDEYNDRFRVYHNVPYGDDYGAPIASGKTPLKALQNAWKNWSIPPVLILNSEHYVPDVDIHMVYSVPWNAGVVE